MAYSLHGFNSKKQRYRLAEIYQYVFIERNLNTSLKKIANKYKHYDIAETTGFSFDSKAGVVILPVTLEIAHEHKIPISQLTDDKLIALGEEAKKQGIQFIGEIPGRHYQLEMTAKYYFHEMYDDLEDYKDRGLSPQIWQAQKITHPTLPIEPTIDTQENYYYDKARDDNVWVSNVSYTIYQSCLRDNCSFCLSEEKANLKDEELRKQTLRELGDLRNKAQFTFNMVISTWMQSLIAELDSLSAEELEEENKMLDFVNEFYTKRVNT